MLELPGVLVYGTNAFEALAKAKLLAMEVVGDRLANGEDPLTGHDLGEASPPFEAAVGFGGIEFHHGGPPMLARIGKKTGLTPEDL